MSAGMYDVNGNRISEQRNLMTDYNRMADHFPDVKEQLNLNTHVMYPHMNTNFQARGTDLKFMPATERAIQESQLAVEREYTKQKKLQEFQRRTKMAAKNYNDTVKTEAQIKQEQEKQDAEVKKNKVKEFEEKLKEMRKSMKVKPKNKENKANDKNEKVKKGIQVKVHGRPASQNKSNNKENQNVHNKVYNNSIVKRPFGATTMWWGTSNVAGNEQKFQFPTYFPITDCVKPATKVANREAAKPSSKAPKKGSKLQQITATSVAIPFGAPEPCQILEKSASIEISIDKHNFEYSSNNNSKVSGPLRESELLDFNRRTVAQKNTNNFNDSEYNTRELFMQSQEKRLPLSKISSENSGFYNERVTNGIGQSSYLNGINEIPEEITMEYVQQMGYGQNYQDFNDEEPIPKMSVPTPHAMVTNYKEARDQKKWQKVNSGAGMF